MKQCFYCGVTLTNPPRLAKHERFQIPVTTATKDHQIPKSRGGRFLENNTVLCCRACNCDKAGLTVDEYRVVIAFRNGLVTKPDVLFNAEKLETLWPPE